MDRLARVVNVLAVRYEVPVLAFIVAEQHRLGSYHAHAILASESPGCSLLELPDSLRFLWLEGSERFGICRAVSIERIGGVVGYVSKYITKRVAEYDFYRLPWGS